MLPIILIASDPYLLHVHAMAIGSRGRGRGCGRVCGLSLSPSSTLLYSLMEEDTAFSYLSNFKFFIPIYENPLGKKVSR
jgi:hypothetical protein